MPVISVVATFRPKAGNEADVEAVLRNMVRPTRAEPGCTRYDLYAGHAPVSFVLFEAYRDQAALDAHRQTEHYKAYRAKIADLLGEPISVQLLHGLDVAQN